jgi:putative RNA 2'-phosphotransferase
MVAYSGVPAMGERAYDGQKIASTIVYALRHDPLKYGLIIDPEGWVDVRDLVIALQFDRRDWEALEWEDVERAIRMNDPFRFDIHEGRIRAAYGHSCPVASPRLRAEPPETLFRATTPGALPEILDKGLEPMQRQLVHLTENLEYARQVARSRQSDAILSVDARRAHEAGVRFYWGNYHSKGRSMAHAPGLRPGAS